MVFEQFFKTEWLQRRPLDAFLLGALYSLMGIISAKLIFGRNPSLMTVAFTSILLIPSLNNLMRQEARTIIRENISWTALFRNHKTTFITYIFLFLGIFTTFAAISISLPSNSVLALFSTQLEAANIAGKAADPSCNYLGIDFGNRFLCIVFNNIIIFFICFLLSLVYGAGAVLFITWNASVWGVAFGFAARTLIIPAFPHMITEAASYLSAAIAGGVLSKAVIHEKLGSKNFYRILGDSLILFAIGFFLVIIAGYLEVYVFPFIRG